MPQFKNISPLGALDVPIIGRTVDRGEVIDLPEARAVFIAGQAETWEPADDEARALAAATAAPTDDDTASDAGPEAPAPPASNDDPTPSTDAEGGEA